MALIALTASCDWAGGSAQETSEKRKTFRGAGITFKYPASWTVTAPPKGLAADEGSPWGSGEIASLSNEDQLRMCEQSASSISCSATVGRLGRNGVVVSWNLFAGLPDGFKPGKRLLAGERRIRIGGSPATRRQDRHTSCSSSAALDQESIDVAVAKPGGAPGDFYGMKACLRGPRFQPLEHQVDAMLDSVRLS